MAAAGSSEQAVLPQVPVENQRSASCCCGQLKITCNEDPVRSAICHCTDCQKRTGSVFGVQARFRRLATTVIGAAIEYTRTGDSGNKVKFHFCGICGSTLYWYPDGLLEFVLVAVGGFADNTLPVPAFSVYGDRCHSWVALPDGIEKYD